MSLVDVAAASRAALLTLLPAPTNCGSNKNLLPLKLRAEKLATGEEALVMIAKMAKTAEIKQ